MSAPKSALGATQVSEQQVGLAWLLRLRWGAVGGQLVALGIARGALGLDLPYATLGGLLALTATSNGVLSALPAGRERPWLIPSILVLDILTLTAMLACSGGASNPFTVLLLVHVALGSLLLEPQLAWALNALTTVGFASLFFLPGAEAHHHGMHGMHDEGSRFSGHLVGMWVAYATAASFVAHFIGKVSRALRDRDRRLAAVAHLARQNERLASLSSFSANAAHELGSPLATIGLAAKELAVGLERGEPLATLMDDASLIGREVRRCREILADLSGRAGETVGEMPLRTTAGALLDELERSLPLQQRPYLHVLTPEPNAREATLVAPARTAAQMLRNLVRNAFEAQEETGSLDPVEVELRVKDKLCLCVRDRGGGISPDVQVRLGEPFMTTKAERGGLGLGVYLARAFAERLGGHLQFRARDGGGTEVELCLARNAVETRSTR